MMSTAMGRGALLLALLLLAHYSHGAQPLRGLLLTSPGVYHDYRYQTEAITSALARQMRIQFDVSLQEQARWKTTDFARGYDIVIYNICTADNQDTTQIANMRRQAHTLKVPAVMIHCTMHSFRETDDWWPLYGLKTYAHEAIDEMPQAHATEHPVLTGIPTDWKVAHDELYINLAFEATPLLTSPADDGQAHVTAWVATSDGTRIFGTTLGHSLQTIDDPVFQRLLGNAVLWATNNLSDQGSASPDLAPDPGLEPVNRVTRAPGVDYLNDEARKCLQREVYSSVAPCYAGCVLHPLKWGSEARECKQTCVAAIPDSDELIPRCVEL